MKLRIITLCALLALLPYAFAQKAGHAASYRAGFNATGHSAIGRSARSAGFGRRTPYASLPFPLFSDGFSDAFDLDDLYASGYPVASQPPVILMQARGMSDANDSRRSRDQSEASAEPLMIELQNGRYVHVSRAAVDGEATPLSFDTQSAAKPQPPQISASRNVPSTVLILHDGQSLELHYYTIANGTLYATGDYYTDGYWSKQIALSSLNLSATLQANARRNVKFVLPSAPNEVIASF